ncbi:MarR family winged helix-turn-helix transcriptional regulator [Halobacteria archaeon AArc-dxtr1]|nr:MarR family winged helix-turn-helix transcriptional regulator [Halobacteria archaeon AArc-dxtr1]
MSSEMAQPTDAVADRVYDLSPSPKLVYKVLEQEGEMTQAELVAASRLCPRTVRYALGKLADVDLVTSRVHMGDARQSVYRLEE